MVSVAVGSLTPRDGSVPREWDSMWAQQLSSSATSNWRTVLIFLVDRETFQNDNKYGPKITIDIRKRRLDKNVKSDIKLLIESYCLLVF